MSGARGLAVIPLFAFLLAALGAPALDVQPGDSCVLWVEHDGWGGWIPFCKGECTPGGCKDPVKVVGGGVTRWWCECNESEIRGGQDVPCVGVLVYNDNYPADPWEGRCHTNLCSSECPDFPDLNGFPLNYAVPLCPCVL